MILGPDYIFRKETVQAGNICLFNELSEINLKKYKFMKNKAHRFCPIDFHRQTNISLNFLTINKV